MTRPAWFETRLTMRLGLRYPIVLGPMAGGPSTPELVAAVSNGGGLGSLGAGYLDPDAVRSAVRAVRALTDRPFAVNVFIPEPPPSDPPAVARAIERARALLAPIAERLGVTLPAALGAPDFEDQMQVLLDERVPVVSFTFGVLRPSWVAAIRSTGAALIGTATTVAEGEALASAGVDAVVAQGAEAGAHRGTFLAPPDRALVGTIALVPQMVDALSVPVIAAGGIMDGRGIAAALMLSAAGVALGTAFVATRESGAALPYKAAVLAAADDSTRVTRAYTGRPARGIVNALGDALGPFESELPPYPLMHALTRDIRAAAARRGDPELMSLWAGQGARMATDRPAAELFQRLVTETDALLG